MWNCRVSGDSALSYGAYTPVFDNLLGFVVGADRSARTYIDLIEENRAIFLETSERRCRNTVVEPRELLFLMNHIDTADRLYWAPRPYRRSGDIDKEYLFVCPENDTLACVFCGFKGRTPLETKSAPVEGGVTRLPVFDATNATTDNSEERSLLDERQRSMIMAARDLLQRELENVRRSTLAESFGGMDETDYVPRVADTTDNSEDGSGNANSELAAPREDINETTTDATEPPITTRRRTRFHFDKCPLAWLESNCTWQTKYSTYPVHEPSKFGFALRMLQRQREQGFMATEMEWNEFVQLTGDTPAMGACEDTLLRCYMMIVQMKLDKVDRYHGDSREFRRLPLYPLYYDTERDAVMRKPRVCRPLACVLEHAPLYGWTYRTDRRSATTLVEPYEFGRSTLDVLREDVLVDRVNNERAAEIVDETRKSKNYLSHILSSDKRSGASKPIPNRVAYAIDMETAWRAFVMHGFCVQHRKYPANKDIYDVVATGDYSSGIGGYSIRQRIDVPTTLMLCIYCGYSFDSKLCNPEVVDALYDASDKESIAEYLLSRSSRVFLTNNLSEGDSREWWNRNPGPNSHLALSVNEVLQRGKNAEQKKKRKRQTDGNNEKMAVWLSASLNSCHSLKCIFRLKNRVWSVEWCPVCLIENTTSQKPLFTCGHTVCDNCINDVRITQCPLCKEGTRKHHIII